MARETLLDRLRKAAGVPRDISPFELQQAEAEATAYAMAEQQEQQARSVERQVREQLEQWKKTQAQAANIDPLDPSVVLPPETQAETHPGTAHALSMQDLRAMGRLPVIAAIVGKRIAQVSPFCRRQRSPNEPGYRVRMRDRKRPPSAAAVKMLAALEAWIETCGDPAQQEDPSFKSFTVKYLYDSLVLDWACAEILEDKRGFPAAMLPMDAATIRRAAATDREYAKGRVDYRNNGYVQVVHNRVMAEWSPSEVMTMIRRPRTDIRLNGYGTPELDELARYVNYLMQAEFYNAANFTNGMHAAGMIAVMSSMNARTFEALDARLRQMMTGAHNAHRMILLQLDPKEKEDIKPIQFTQTNKEMEFGQWIGWLLKMTCFPAGTAVQMWNEGRKNIEDLRPGDTVLTHKGTAGKVVNVQIKEHVGEMRKLVRSDTITLATEEHPFWACRSSVKNMKKQFEEPEWVKAKDLLPGEHYLVVPKSACPDNGQSFIDLAEYIDDTFEYADEETVHGKFSRTVSIPRKIPLNKYTAFVLGLFFAEGCAHKSVISFSFHEDEKDYGEMAKWFAGVLGVKCAEVVPEGKHARNVVIFSAILARAFGKLFGDLSKNRSIPKEILSNTEEIVQAFISGAFAGDGSVYLQEGKYPNLAICGISEGGLKDMQALLYKLGVPSMFYSVARSKNSCSERAQPLHSVRVQGAYLWRAAEWLVGPKADKLRALLAERKETATHAGHLFKSTIYEKSFGFLVPLKKNEAVPFSGKVYNCEVEGEHTYVVENAAVHNCAFFQMDPAELNFLFGNEGQHASFTTADPEERTSMSKEQGLSVLLHDYAGVLNRKIIQRLDPDFELTFEGIDVRNPLTQSQLDQQAVQNWASVNEIRATRDLPPLDHWVFNVPLSSVVVSTINQENMKKQEQEQQAQQSAQQGQQPQDQVPAEPEQAPPDAEEDVQGYDQGGPDPSDPRSALPAGTDLKQLLNGVPGNGAGQPLAKGGMVPVLRVEVQA